MKGIVVLVTCWLVEGVNHVNVITTPTPVTHTPDNVTSVLSLCAQLIV